MGCWHAKCVCTSTTSPPTTTYMYNTTILTPLTEGTGYAADTQHTKSHCIVDCTTDSAHTCERGSGLTALTGTILANR